MRRLMEITKNETIDGVEVKVKHYISNWYRSYREKYAITINKDDKELLEKLVDYLFSVSFDSTSSNGWHMPTRVHGRHESRRKGEIFADKFIGCMGEIALYKFIRDKIDDEIAPPNLDDPKGFCNSDTRDLFWREKSFSIKTTKDTHNLLLFQKEHYDENGNYAPNIARNVAPSYFDYHVLCRIKSSYDGIDYIEKLRIKKDTISAKERQNLRDIIFKTNWRVDVAGFISNQTFVSKIINANPPFMVYASTTLERKCFGKGEFNPYNEVDVDNYYIQTKDLTLPYKLRELTNIKGKVKYSDLENHYAYLVDEKDNEYYVGKKTISRTKDANRILSKKENIILSFNVVKRKGKLYAQDIKELNLPTTNKE